MNSIKQLKNKKIHTKFSLLLNNKLESISSQANKSSIMHEDYFITALVDTAKEVNKKIDH